MKKTKGSKLFDILFFARRDIKKAEIPPQITMINKHCFEYCKQLDSIIFDPESSLECINYQAFAEISGPEKIVFPPSLKEIKERSFYNTEKLKDVEFLGESIKIGHDSFFLCDEMQNMFFPNATEIVFNDYPFKDLPQSVKIHVKRNAKLTGVDTKTHHDKINYIEEDSKPAKKEPIEKKRTQKVQSKAQNDKTDNDYVRYLRAHLSKYENVLSIEEFKQQGAKEDFENEDETQVKNKSNAEVFIGPEDEKFHKVVRKIGEGATCDVYKVIDMRTGRVMCKKIIKANHEEEMFNVMKNALKEIEVLLSINHPCICKAIGYNMQEEIPGQTEEEEDNKTTIALFFELLPYKIKDVIDKNMMNNTLKARIAIEVAFGMSYIHSLGMMHRDLKLENIMLNCVLESKIIDFGLVRVQDLSGTSNSMTKGIGTLAYMSPEMMNDEDYDSKTDVYSYGIVLFVLFTGSLPKQSMKEKLSNTPIKFPQPSSSITQYCINLIKKCTSYKPNKRPSFDQIIQDMAKNSFELAKEIDFDIINSRYHELNRFKATHTINSSKK